MKTNRSINKLCRASAASLAVLLASTLPAQAPKFIRGDINLDGRVTLADVSYYYDFRYLGGPAPGCMDAADTDDTGAIDTATSGDAAFLLDWLSHEDGAPRVLPPPFPLAGVDPTNDGLPCTETETHPPGLPDRRYSLDWVGPAAIRRGDESVELFLNASTGAAIESFAAAYRIEKSVLADVRVDLRGTIFPAALRASYEASTVFRTVVTQSADSRFDLLLIGAVFIAVPPVGGFERIAFPATAGAIKEKPMLRLVARVRPDAPLGPQVLLRPALDEDFLVQGVSIHGMVSEAAPLGKPGLAPQLLLTSEMNPSILFDGEEFLRGNANADATVDISDVLHTVGFLFLGGPAPDCLDSADSNDDGVMDISDASYTLGFLFLGKAAPPLPGPVVCGYDETGDMLIHCDKTCP